MPAITNTQLKLLERLCNAVAVSGDEGEVRQIILAEVRPFADEVKVDALGNVLVTKNGTERSRSHTERSRSTGSKRVRVMLDAHMDEVGFMLVADDGEGIFRFETVGGLDVRQLAGKPVLVGRNKIPGVIGARPIHLTTLEERQRKIPLDQLRIDIGPGGKARPGERATFATKFRRAGPSIFAKAIDNRIGCAILIEILKNAPWNVDLCLSFSVQEEIGLRGAKVAAQYFNPDMAIAIDSTPANDLPMHDGSENISYNTRLGLGPAIYTFDAGTLSDPRLVRLLAESGDAEKIPYQFRQPGGGGTDAGAIHKALAGIPIVSVSVPGRYAHTSTLVARLDDWKNTLALVQAALRRIGPDLLAAERR